MSTTPSVPLACDHLAQSGSVQTCPNAKFQEPKQRTISAPDPQSRGIPEPPAQLSPRERQIVGLVARGFRNREIADALFISEQTVKNHLAHVFLKLGVQDRLELALHAVYFGLHLDSPACYNPAGTSARISCDSHQREPC